MTQFESHNVLPVIDFELKPKLYAQIKERIFNLKLKDLESDDKFERMLDTLSREFSMEPVIFDEPKIVDHTFHNEKTTRKYSVKVKIDFTGSLILFTYKPNGYQWGSSDYPYIFQPNTNSVDIVIETYSIDTKDHIINEAKRMMTLTYQFAGSNSRFVKDWNDSFKKDINGLLIEQREKLKTLYG